MSVVSLHPRGGAPVPAGAAPAYAAAYCRLAGASWHGRPLDRPQTVLQALLEYNPRNFDQRIIVELRPVRLAAALLTGAALGVAGLLLQTVIRNPLGEPHILGLNAGASLAVVATSALGLSFGAFPPRGR